MNPLLLLVLQWHRFLLGPFFFLLFPLFFFFFFFLSVDLLEVFLPLLLTT